MSEYVKFRKVENVELSYNGPTYLSMRTGDTLNTPKTDFRDGMIGLINVSCKITKLDGTIVDIVDENAFDFNNDYGDVIRYKDSEDNIKSFYDGEILEEIRVDGNYLKITPVLVCEVNDYGQERVKLIVGQSPTPKVYVDIPTEIKQHHINQGTIDGGDTIEFNLATFPDADGYTLSDPHYFLYFDNYFGDQAEQLWLVRTNDLGNDVGSAYMEYFLSDGGTWLNNFDGDVDYNGMLYSISHTSTALSLSYKAFTFTSLNDIYIRVDGVLRAEVRHNFSLNNPFSIEDRFGPSNIEVKVFYTDDQLNGRILNYSLGEYTFISGVNHLIFGSEPTSSGIFLVQVNVGKFYDGSGDKDISSNVSEIPVMELDPHAIELFTYKPIYYFGERFDRIVVSCYALYKITESINYRALIGGSSYSLNVANGTQLFQNTLLVATLVNSEYGTLTSELTLLVEVDTRQELLVYDKITGAEKNFGGLDMSSGFNIGFNLDGTLDSCSVQVFNGEDYALETNTLCMLTFNRSWWVVKSDKKEYINSETTNKYKHTIELLDPRHLLKSRSLVSCGFNKDRYTYQSFLDRLISLSNFNNASVSLGNVFNANNKVSVIKSFDNYTLGKALEEFANSENAIHKVDYIDKNSPYIYFLSKSGNNETIIDLDNDTTHKIASYVNEEMGNKDFASKVISNIENAISSVPQRYPLTGGKFLDADEFELTKDNAYFKMPSKAFKVNKLIVVPSIVIYKYTSTGGGTEIDKLATRSFYAYSVEQILDILSKDMPTLTSVNEYSLEEFARDVFEVAKAELTIDKQENKLINVMGDTHIMFISESMSNKYDKQQWYFKHKEGDEKITNFKCLDYTNGSLTNGTKLSKKQTTIFDFLASGSYGTRSCVARRRLAVDVPNQTTDYIGVYAEYLTPLDTKFAVEYIPQSDMSMTYENGTKTKDITLFNQTGNFIDNFAVSKLVKSYATDISGNTHNYYSYYENYFDILEVGRKVYKVINGKQELMVISNVSIDVINGSKYAVMYSLSKHSAVKSLMISADSNIRDYDTPQRNNVKRKQNYKDYIELNFDGENTGTNLPYASVDTLVDLLTLESKRKGSQVDYVAFIGIDNWNIDSEHRNPNARYFQIPTYAVYYDSSVSVMVDFNDNNIIGYDKTGMGTTMNWNIGEWNTFFGKTARYNVPIDYTASSGIYGELTQIDLKLANKTTIDSTFEEYKDEVSGLSEEDSPYTITEVAPLSFEKYHELMSDQQVHILEEHYNKDGLEVPFFQYTFQIGSTEDIRVGSHILVNGKSSAEKIFLYQFHIRNDARSDNYNFNPLTITNSTSTTITLNNACVFTFEPYGIGIIGRRLKVKFYATATFNILTGEVSNTTNYGQNIKNKNIEIVSASYEKGTLSESELIMAIDNCKKELDGESILEINVSNYRR